LAGNILLVEDDPDISNIIQANLKYYGFKVVIASNGAEALELISKHQFDLIITDLMMPVMDGNQFVKDPIALVQTVKRIIG
jgi:DNA-binding response OmpR family regulator